MTVYERCLRETGSECRGLECCRISGHNQSSTDGRPVTLIGRITAPIIWRNSHGIRVDLARPPSRQPRPVYRNGERARAGHTPHSASAVSLINMTLVGRHLAYFPYLFYAQWARPQKRKRCDGFLLSAPREVAGTAWWLMWTKGTEVAEAASPKWLRHGDSETASSVVASGPPQCHPSAAPMPSSSPSPSPSSPRCGASGAAPLRAHHLPTNAPPLRRAGQLQWSPLSAPAGGLHCTIRAICHGPASANW